MNAPETQLVLERLYGLVLGARRCGRFQAPAGSKRAFTWIRPPVYFIYT